MYYNSIRWNLIKLPVIYKPLSVALGLLGLNYNLKCFKTKVWLDEVAYTKADATCKCDSQRILEVS